MNTPKELWANFVSAISRDGERDHRGLFTSIATWIRENSSRIDEAAILDYGLLDYSSLPPDEYPLELSDVNVAEEIDHLRHLNPDTFGSLAMHIRDVLWELVAFKTDIQCPRCPEQDLRALSDVQRNSLVFACDVCTWTQYGDGTAYQSEARLIPATMEQLRNAKVLR